MICSENGCSELATAHLVFVSQRQVFLDGYFCDPHGKECVHRNLGYNSFCE